MDELKTCEVCGETSQGGRMHSGLWHRLDDRISACEERLTKKLSELPGAAVEEAWSIIANAFDGNWEKASPEWRQAAERWRDKYITRRK